ncbi:hypothetical protein BX600DRAFT_318272 [Xylariales sp. PMI_506]|nr:hypothetical protein BX600DRAFT_318272 [Xylariales sp. PMI_506]
MDPNRVSHARHSRVPLGDATARIINVPGPRRKKSSQSQDSGVNPPNPLRAHPVPSPSPHSASTSRNQAPPAADARVSSAANSSRDGQKRVSHVSTSSGTSIGKRKTHIGPWQLGKTLGKGSAGRVRLARHHLTQEQVAVKILPKNGQHMTQASSLADIDKWDRTQPEFSTEKRMPLSIEREVAILKLIDHPNIMKLYDIWENRSEIYLVLEYIEQGDLFEYINLVGPIPEVETVFYFRQIISALDYCHSFNICHRDLKPENILLSSSGQIKIADFGMAAIQQNPNHRLKTACGSPHYAAPELVSRRGRGYHGATVDVWSVGIILYACLCARLPFDDNDLPTLLAKAKHGAYYEPPELSVGSRNLIRRMLNPEPEERITIAQIWKHEFIVYYDSLDDLNGKRYDDDLDEIRKHGRSTKLLPEDIDVQTLRQLKSMWHMYTEKELAMKLISNEHNDQKLFYWLLFNYREKRLENYVGDLTYSPSDYHHLRPANWTKKYTTLEFPSRYGRTPSRFTVISHVTAEENGVETATDGGTVQSYDPYKSSRVMGESEASHAKITVHRNGSVAKGSTRSKSLKRVKSGSLKSNSTYSRRRIRARPASVATAMKSSRRSIISIKSAEGTAYQRPASRHKRGVSFTHDGKQSISTSHQPANKDSTSSTGGNAVTIQAQSQLPPPRTSTTATIDQDVSIAEAVPIVNVSKAKDTHSYWNDELCQFSDSIAKDCDVAFNSSLLLPDSRLEESVKGSSRAAAGAIGSNNSPTQDMASMATPIHTGPIHKASKSSNRNPGVLETRPLPPAPHPTESVLHEIMMSKKRTDQRKNKPDGPPSYLDRMKTHLDRLAPGDSRKADPDRRAVSAPIYSQYSSRRTRSSVPKSLVYEKKREEQRTTSDPLNGGVPSGQPNRSTRIEHNGLEYLARQENTIRVVTSPSNTKSSARPQETLVVHKRLSKPTPDHVKAQTATIPHRQDKNNSTNPNSSEVERVSYSSPSGPPQKKSSWFKRPSKDRSDSPAQSDSLGFDQEESKPRAQDSTKAADMVPSSKKKSFSFAFWKNSKDQNHMKLLLADTEFDDTPSPEPVRLFSYPVRSPLSGVSPEDVTVRNIEPQQNWLARLFRVKPACEYLCFNIPRRHARQEIAILLKEWRRYGIRDVQVDKDRNIVFGRVGPKNYLNMKEVSFAAEIMTVIEHGKRNPLSIVRLTQERGAASSFHKVVDTMHAVFSVRCLLVVDKQKIKMMVKTLNS